MVSDWINSTTIKEDTVPAEQDDCVCALECGSYRSLKLLDQIMKVTERVWENHESGRDNFRGYKVEDEHRCCTVWLYSSCGHS